MSPVDLPTIRIITVSGRIASGATTLAKGLSEILGWKHIEGGEVFWEAIRKEKGFLAKDTNLRRDQDDRLFDERLKKILREDEHIVLETKLAGFNAQGIAGVFKIAVVCENDEGEDQPQIRIDRLVNREGMPVEEAKEEVFGREQNDLVKWRKLYTGGDSNWVYWEKNYHDLVINTYSHNQEETLKIALAAIGLPTSMT